MKSLNVDLSEWGQIRMTGADRVRFLHGMCTASIETLAPGGWLRACVLNAKGRVLSVIEVVRRDEHLLLLCEPDNADKTIETLSRYAVMDDVELARVHMPLHCVWPDPAGVWTAAPVFAPPPEPVATAEEVEIRRVEAGLPRFGVDVCEDYFPFESHLRTTIDYEKGCYIGQEPVSRVHHRGKPNKSLLALLVTEGQGPVSADAVVRHADRDSAGTVTSSVVSPDFGPIALAYLHRDVWQPGTRVTVDGRAATVAAVPLS